MVKLLEFLRGGSSSTSIGYIKASELFGYREKQSLLQVNDETIHLKLLSDEERLKCDICGYVHSGSFEEMPCPKCHGNLYPRNPKDVDENRSVKRIRKPLTYPLVAGEHTAQVPNQDRLELENMFKALPEESSVNVLACSPTLEMGIDVGGLDAVVMRNIPPRPDNYAQRGGRAGRRSRVGLVVGYARSTPHDQYFYDNPREMIAGEVKAPAVSLANRDIFLRHLFAITFSLSEVGLSSQMLTYVDAAGKIQEDKVDELIESIQSCSEEALKIAHGAWDEEIFGSVQLTDDDLRKELAELPSKIRDIVERTSKQVLDLRASIERWTSELKSNQKASAIRASNLVSSLLGQVSSGNNERGDDRSAGYPMRRFAEFGLLPSYEFPTQPATLRLLGDSHEEDPISVTRRFGIGQFQPEGHVYARNKRWRTIGLDTSSPWNPQADEIGWKYQICPECGLRFAGDAPRCPRCNATELNETLSAYEFAGFLAKPDDRPVVDEEERYAVRNLVKMYPQWNGTVVRRWSLPNGWGMSLSRQEEVRWVNEGMPVTPSDLENGKLILNNESKGYLICPTCGHMLEQPDVLQENGKGRKKPKTKKNDSDGHSQNCQHKGHSPSPLAICCEGKVEILRILIPIPIESEKSDWESWALSLGYSLLNGMQLEFMLSQNEIDFELEGAWQVNTDTEQYQMLSLAFIDANIGGSGYLERIGDELNSVARRSIDHLDHEGCQTACYRCLKTYQNQRYHDKLNWTMVLPTLYELLQRPPVHRPSETGDIDDPKPWLEAYDAGVGSPLELKFLRIFEKHGFHPEKQIPISPVEGEVPITVADFVLPEKRVAIYIDGAAFHVGKNLVRDKYLRDRLRSADPPWTVVELKASDLSRIAQVIEKIKEIMTPRQIT